MRTGLSFCVLAAFLVACGGSGAGASPEVATGRARLSLSGTGADGYTYRVVGYTLRVEGPQSLVVTETPDETVWITLRTGHYTVALDGDWHVERTDAPGVPIDVQLVSPNPLAFGVWEGEETAVHFTFKLPSQGDAAVTMGIDSGGWISGSFLVAGVDDPNGPFMPLFGTEVPFAITWPAARISQDPLRTSLDIDTATVQFGPSVSPILDEFASSLRDAPLRIELTQVDDGVLVTLSPLMRFVGPVEYELALSFPAALPGSVRGDGSPRLGTYAGEAQIRLTRGSAGAAGSAPLTLVAR